MKFLTAADKKFKPMLDRLIESVIALKYDIIVYDLGGLGFGIPYDAPVSDTMFQKNPVKPRYILEMLQSLKKNELLIWLDADTVLKHRIDEIENDEFDLGVTIRKEKKGKNPRRGRINSGVMFFRNNERTCKFMMEWMKESERLNGDQWALNNLIDVAPVVNLIVKEYPGVIYNNYYFDESQNIAKILHYKTDKRNHIK